MIRGFLLVFWMCFSLALQAQTSMDQFLLGARQSPGVTQFSDQEKYLETEPFRLSYLQKLEFRTSNRRLNTDRNQFGIRFSPTNPWEVKRNKEYFESIQSGLPIKQQLALGAELKTRYLAIIAVAKQSENFRLAGIADSLIRVELDILEQQSGSAYFDADDYVDLQLEQVESQTKLDEARYDLMLAQGSVYELQKGIQPHWKFEDLIHMETIKRIVDSLAIRQSESILVQWQMQKVLQAQKSYALEKANLNLGFFQTEYDTRSALLNETPINFSFGITLPVVNPNKPDMARKKLNELEAQADLEMVRNQEELKGSGLRDQLQNLFQELAAVESRLVSLKSRPLPKTLQILKGGDPKIPVRYAAGLIPLEKLIVRIKTEIYKTYIIYLEENDHLQALPLINYLSNSLNSLE